MLQLLDLNKNKFIDPTSIILLRLKNQLRVNVSMFKEYSEP